MEAQVSVMELATQLNDRLVRADERVADVGKLLSAKRMDAIRKLDQTYESFKEKLASMEEQSRMQVETFKVQRSLQLKGVAGRLNDYRQQLTALVEELQKATEAGDTKSSLLVEHRLNQFMLDVNVNELTYELQWLQHLELVANEKLATMETLLHSPLHYLRTLALSPGDISLSIACEESMQGRTVVVEVRQNRSDERAMALLEYRVQDSELNDLPKREEHKMRADGTIAVLISFLPKRVGRHVIAARLYGEHVRGSPLSVLVESEGVEYLAGEKHWVDAEQNTTAGKKEPNKKSESGLRGGNQLASEQEQPERDPPFFNSAVKREPASPSPSATARTVQSAHAEDWEATPVHERRQHPPPAQTPVVNPMPLPLVSMKLSESTTQVTKTARPPPTVTQNTPSDAEDWDAVPALKQTQQRPLLTPLAVEQQKVVDSQPIQKPVVERARPIMSSAAGENWDAAPPPKRQPPSKEPLSAVQQQKTIDLQPSMAKTAQSQSPPLMRTASPGAEDWDAASVQKSKRENLPTPPVAEKQMVDLRPVEQSRSMMSGAGAENWESAAPPRQFQSTVPKEPSSTSRQQKLPDSQPPEVALMASGGEDWDAVPVQQQRSSRRMSAGEEQKLTESQPTVEQPRPSAPSGAAEHGNDVPQMQNHDAAQTSGSSVRPKLMAMVAASSRKCIAGEQKLQLGVHGAESDPNFHFSKPIGCTFDEATGSWIVCDTGHNMVKVYSASGAPKFLAKGQFDKPSAVVVVEQGRTFAVKDDSAIAFFDLRTDGAAVRVIHRLHRPIGLAMDGRGRLVTLMNAFNGQNALIETFDWRAPQQGAVASHNYRPAVQNGAVLQNLKPRFIDAHGHLLAISDLGANMVFLTSLVDGTTVKAFGSEGRRAGEFIFVSGVRFDDESNILVGDAKTGRVQFFDGNGSFQCVLDLDQPTGFVSDLHVTADGRLMAMNRGSHTVKLFQLSSK